MDARTQSRAERSLTVSEIDAMPEPMRTEARRRVMAMVMGQMHAKYERYLDRDYEMADANYRRHELGD